MTSSSFESSKAVPTEITPFDLSFAGPVPQGKKKKSSRSVFSQVVVLFFLVGLCFTVYSRLSSLASSTSLVNQSISKSVNKDQNENDNIVFPTASLVESKTKTRLQQVTEDTTTTELSDGKANKHVLRFPEGVYDESMTSPGQLSAIINNCNEAADPKSDPEVLACQIYTNAKTPIVLGTLKTGADVLAIATDMGTISSSDVSSLFVDHALAAMIKRGCFEWNNQDSPVKATTVAYQGKESYKNTFSKETGMSVDSSVSFLGISVSAGYEQSNSHSGGSEGTTETAYGQEKYSAMVGTLTNTCFGSQASFDERIKDLIKPKSFNCWTAIRRYGRTPTTSLEDYSNNLKNLGGDCFLDVANGGFEMPLKYIYRVGTKTTLTTTYTASSTTAASDASSAITAGIEATHGKVSGSVDSAITKAFSETKGDSTSVGNLEKTTVGFGTKVGITCFKDGECDDKIEKAVKFIRNDFTRLSSPSSLGREYISLDDIMELYFGDYGLPDQFLAAYNIYGYSRRGTVCWAYNFAGRNLPTENKHNCWTTSKNIVPTGIETNYSKTSVVASIGMPDPRVFSGTSIPSHPESCCNQCESTIFCDANCQQRLSFLSQNLDRRQFYTMVNDACA